ncbi:MAG: hypothetical protein A2V59_09785 [Armatimonadetes bacterium RBG_19FT_COMBO_69_19]|nr:MAG: hypothetical protein A2V59_09785 [Armatimonadetes bacterium RBG_19FT_COMBO_69_19]
MTVRHAKPAERLRLSAGISWLLVLTTAGAASAQVHAYGLAAKVNGVGISNETLERNFQEYLRENNVNLAAIRNPERVKGMRREALDLLIDQELAWQAAQREKVLATPAEVDEAVGAMRAQFKSEQAFASRLAIEGYTETSYREHLRRLVSARKYLDRVAENASKVSEEEVHAFYAANPEKFTMTEGSTQSIVSEDAAREQIRSYLQGVKGRDAVQAELSCLRSAAKIEVHLPL